PDAQPTVYAWTRPGAVEGLADADTATLHRFDRVSTEWCPLAGSSVDVGALFADNADIVREAGFALLFCAGDADVAAVVSARLAAPALMNLSPEHHIGWCALGSVDAALAARCLGLAAGHTVLHSLAGGAL